MNIALQQMAKFHVYADFNINITTLFNEESAMRIINVLLELFILQIKTQLF